MLGRKRKKTHDAQKEAMVNTKISLYVESRYKANRKRIHAAVRSILKERSIEEALEVSVAIVGDRKMHALNKQYRGKDSTTNVLSFSQTEGEHMKTPPGIMYLGDVVISYPQVIREAAAEDELVDDKIDVLVKHGVMHLLGLHHE